MKKGAGKADSKTPRAFGGCTTVKRAATSGLWSVAFEGFTQGENKSQRIWLELRRLALTQRRRERKEFCSIPEAAARYGVSRTCVRRIFVRLKQEGILQLMRGSRSLVRPRAPRIRANIRGIIVVPVWITGFVIFYEMRIFCSVFENAVRQAGYVTNFVFYGDETGSELIERILWHEPDMLLWPVPDVTQEWILNAIEDRGVNVLVVSDRPKYRNSLVRVDLSSGLRAGLESWRQAGIREIHVPTAPGPVMDSATHVLAEMMRESGFRWKILRPRNLVYKDYLKSLGRTEGSAVLFDNDYWAQHLLRSCPQEFVDVLARCRTALFRSINFPPHRLRALKVDALITDYKTVALAACEEISSGRYEKRVFRPAWKSEVCADQLATQFEKG